jgi:NAD(P)-dependent dehydrogenase (short-subunit alcohol dehydrogenase family)
MRQQASGVIVNISSIAGRLAPIPTQGAYAASKHALCALTDSINAECAPFGINAFCIEPGFFATAIMDKDTFVRLDDDDPYKAPDGRRRALLPFQRRRGTAADAVAELVLAATDGTLNGGAHHPVGVPGLGPTPSAARDASTQGDWHRAGITHVAFHARWATTINQPSNCSKTGRQ